MKSLSGQTQKLHLRSSEKEGIGCGDSLRSSQKRAQSNASDADLLLTKGDYIDELVQQLFRFALPAHTRISERGHN
jgi:hypothetical protein